MNKKVTVGEEVLKRLLAPDPSQGIIDTQREADKEYFVEIDKCVATHKSWHDPWYIVIHHKKEHLLENVIRRYFIARQSMPTPQWDQTVWRYEPNTTDLIFLWVLPDENTAKWMAANPADIHPEQHHLLSYVLECLDKTLYRKYYSKFHSDDKFKT